MSLSNITFTVTLTPAEAWSMSDDLLALNIFRGGNGDIGPGLLKIAAAHDEAVRALGEPMVEREEIEVMYGIEFED